MATATAINRPPPIKLEPGVPQVLAFRFLTPKEVLHGLMFGTMDKRPLFLTTQEGNDFEHTLADMAIQPGEPIRVTKIQHTRGGGFDYRVERAVSDESQLEKDLRQSIANETAKRIRRAPGSAARALTEQEAYDLGMGGAERTSAPEATAAPALKEKATAITPTVQLQPHDTPGSGTADQPGRITPVTAKFMGAYVAAVDILVEARIYAKRKDLVFDIRCEDVRCLAATIMINNGGAR